MGVGGEGMLAGLGAILGFEWRVGGGLRGLILR